DRRQMGGRNPADSPRPGAGAQNHGIGRLATSIGDDAGGSPAGDLDLANRTALMKRRAGAPHRDGQSSSDSAVFDLMVVPAQHRTGKPGAQMRLEAADLGCRQPFEVEAEAPLKFVGEAKLIEVVAGQSDDDRALVAVFDRDAGS